MPEGMQNTRCFNKYRVRIVKDARVRDYLLFLFHQIPGESRVLLPDASFATCATRASGRKRRQILTKYLHDTEEMGYPK